MNLAEDSRPVHALQALTTTVFPEQMDEKNNAKPPNIFSKADDGHGGRTIPLREA
jgi:hypothetical protein